MAKLVVDNFGRLTGIRESYFYRIIGSVIDFNANAGTLQLMSILDGSKCDIELNLDNEIREANQGSMFHKGLVVDVNVVNARMKDMCVLSATLINVVNLPGSLIDYRDTLLEYSEII